MSNRLLGQSLFDAFKQNIDIPKDITDLINRQRYENLIIDSVNSFIETVAPNLKGDLKDKIVNHITDLVFDYYGDNLIDYFDNFIQNKKLVKKDIQLYIMNEIYKSNKQLFYELKHTNYFSNIDLDNKKVISRFSGPHYMSIKNFMELWNDLVDKPIVKFLKEDYLYDVENLDDVDGVSTLTLIYFYKRLNDNFSKLTIDDAYDLDGDFDPSYYARGYFEQYQDYQPLFAIPYDDGSIELFLNVDSSQDDNLEEITLRQLLSYYYDPNKVEADIQYKNTATKPR